MAVNDSKKYWWIKLNKDFFDKHYIKVIRGMPNGDKYVIVYLRLMLESCSHDGRLRFSENIPYNEQMLSSVLDEDIDVIRSALTVLKELKLIQLLKDGTLFINEVNKITGSETGQTIRKREAKQNKEEPLKIESGKNEVKNTLEYRVRDKSIDIDNNIIICFELPLLDGTLAQIVQEDIDLWTKSYPAVDVLVELNKIKSWLDANPKNRKTRSGWKRFVNSWLAREQDKIKPARNNKKEAPVPDWLKEYEEHFEETVEDL